MGNYLLHNTIYTDWHERHSSVPVSSTSLSPPGRSLVDPRASSFSRSMTYTHGFSSRLMSYNQQLTTLTFCIGSSLAWNFKTRMGGLYCYAMTRSDSEATGITASWLVGNHSFCSELFDWRKQVIVGSPHVQQSLRDVDARAAPTAQNDVITAYSH